jgi:protein-S-isoprenylcysteine O-methyltransferase Ste14
MSGEESDQGAPGVRKGTRSKITLFFQVFIYVAMMAGITLLIAGRWDWWMAWAYFAAYLVMLLVGVMIAPLDQELIEERTSIKEGVKRWDRALTAPLSFVYPFGLFILVGVEMRLGHLLQFPFWAQIAGLVGSVAGQMLSTWAMASNKFYGRFVRIQKERGHYVVKDGPYRYVRHPGYLGVMLTALGTAFAIGSLWALVLTILISVLLIVRTALEDKVLREELEGYSSYAQSTRYRLLPGIW